MNRRELIGTVSAVTLGLGVLGFGLKNEIDNMPGSYKAQINQSLGEAGLKATGLTLNPEQGKYTFHQNEDGGEEICVGSYGSADHINVDIDPLIDCSAADGESDPIIAVK